MRQAVLVLTLAATPACATHQPALAAEAALDAGSAAWDAHVDATIEGCRAKSLETKAERSACVGDVADMDAKVVSPGVTLAVAALRAYWLGVAVGESPLDLARHMAEFAEAVADLPAEFFGGLRGMR